jgi:chorismate mutase
VNPLNKPSVTIEELRTAIDSIDDSIVDLFNERAQVVLEVGRLKSGSNL